MCHPPVTPRSPSILVNQMFTIMEQRGITQREAAKRMGATDATVSHWRRGRHIPNMIQFEKWMEAVGVEFTFDLDP